MADAATSEERAARNEATFREANEDIANVAAEMHEIPLVPFLCECEDVRCTAIVQLTLDTYRNVRSNRRRFVVQTGHDGDARSIGGGQGFAVIEKDGRAGDIVEELAP